MTFASSMLIPKSVLMKPFDMGFSFAQAMPILVALPRLDMLFWFFPFALNNGLAAISP
jgi:hypothetical protein